MRYDPQTVWACALEWYRANVDAELDVADAIRHRQLRLHVYVQGEDGCYKLDGQKLYWQEVPGRGQGTNVDPWSLREAAARLGHVVLAHKPSRFERMWPTWVAFAADAGLDAL